MALKNTTAIILAGGRGTRLGELTKDIPKPLLPVAGRPFIFHVLDYLNEQGIKKVILSVGYLGHQFEKLLGKNYQELSLDYSIEETPLGTGGALAEALSMVQEKNVFAFNGDTLFQADLKELEKRHDWQQAALSLVLRHVEDTSRYGRIEFEKELVTHFHEKGIAGPGHINGGIYLVQKKQWPSFEKETCSLESEVLPQMIHKGKVACITSDQYFIDIGVIEDVEKGQKELKKIFYQYDA